MGRCRFCNDAISWRQLNGKWVPFSLKGSIHHCERMTHSQIPVVDPYHAICAKCWKPIVWGRNGICSCVNPIYVHKREAALLKAKFLSSQRSEEKLAKKRERETYLCLVCEAPAVAAGDSVICTEDSSHVFPVNYYQLEATTE